MTARDTKLRLSSDRRSLLGPDGEIEMAYRKCDAVINNKPCGREAEAMYFTEEQMFLCSEHFYTINAYPAIVRYSFKMLDPETPMDLYTRALPAGEDR